MTGEQKTRTILDQAACQHCTAWDHPKHKGRGGKELGEPKCKTVVNGTECGQNHGRWFHEIATTNANTGSVTVEDPRLRIRSPGLYEVYKVQMQGGDQGSKLGMVMIDGGSDTDFVRHDYAESLGLTGTPVYCWLKVVDNDYQRRLTKNYTLEVVDRNGERHSIVATGIDSITTLPMDPDLKTSAASSDGPSSGSVGTSTRTSRRAPWATSHLSPWEICQGRGKPSHHGVCLRMWMGHQGHSLQSPVPCRYSSGVHVCGCPQCPVGCTDSSGRIQCVPCVVSRPCGGVPGVRRTGNHSIPSLSEVCRMPGLHLPT